MQEKIRKFRIFQNSSIEIHSKSSGNVSVLFESSPFGDNWFRKENNRLAEQPQPFSRGEGGPPERSEERRVGSGMREERLDMVRRNRLLKT